VSVEPVQQLQHSVPGVGVVLIHALPRTVPEDGLRARSAAGIKT
jgi:hypothetical protein